MAGIDKTVQTEEAIRLRNGETVTVDGVMVKLNEKQTKLHVIMPSGMNGDQLNKWLERNARVMGYKMSHRADPQIGGGSSKKKVVKKNEDFEPLQPYVEV